MDKIKELLQEYPAVKVFGGAGIIIIIIILTVSTIYSVEVENIWNRLVHPKTESQSDPNSGDDGIVVQPSETPFDAGSEFETEEPIETEKPESSFDGKELRGTLIGEDSREETYVPQQTGIYRFDFDIDSVKKNYLFYIIDSADEELTSKYYSDSDPAGTTVTLESGREYTLIVKSEESDEYDEVEYTITVNVPDAINIVEDNEMKGKIRYIDQEIEYVYTAPKSGIYRFDFDINDVNQNYGFYLCDEKEEELSNKEYYNEGSTLELEKDKEYKILVFQKEGLPEYDISIGVPNDIKKVTGNKIKGKLKYTDQVNTYYYTPIKTSTYKFNFGINDVNNSYNFVLLNKKKEELINTTSGNEERTVELKGGERYEIQIKQDTGYCSYNIKIALYKE